ncbi:hypothetical protein A9Q84_12715 [Halobacteriovorax marinus]|uniref:Cyclic nucleotide-binding domain-containing protein n=1 Tax=Halobacteriovorax marinus TaxID=97084 RepID=A0A1Y5FF16_9BACT|nr:hypothetical protein A9Q84_12715 [Halobacteriovorax marinus]
MKQHSLHLKAHDQIFRENDIAEAMYIVKRGIVRLYKPKGKGFIELATIHSGELIGEMSYFDEGNKKRSCSAETLVDTELVEIKFADFSHMMNSTNPWFQTIINTLVARLLNSNKKVTNFESNSVSINYANKGANDLYKFFKDIDIVRLFSIFYLAIKGQEEEGVEDDDDIIIHKEIFSYFATDIFNFNETKITEFLEILENSFLIELVEDIEGELDNILVLNVDLIKRSFIFFNKQRQLPDQKKTSLDERSLKFFSEILRKHKEKPFIGENPLIDFTDLINEFKENFNIYISMSDFKKPIAMELLDEPKFNQEQRIVAHVNIEKLESLIPLLLVKKEFASFNENMRLK